jgi:hypothetical protein
MVEGQTNISWSNNEGFLQDFHLQFLLAQKGLKDSRINIAKLQDAFDAMHEMWRMETPYMDEKDSKKFRKRHDEIKSKMDNYRTANYGMRQLNFKRLFNEIDEFFTELTEKAVSLGFYPKRLTKRTIEDKMDAMRIG